MARPGPALRGRGGGRRFRLSVFVPDEFSTSPGWRGRDGVSRGGGCPRVREEVDRNKVTLSRRYAMLW